MQSGAAQVRVGLEGDRGGQFGVGAGMGIGHGNRAGCWGPLWKSVSQPSERCVREVGEGAVQLAAAAAVTAEPGSQQLHQAVTLNSSQQLHQAGAACTTAQLLAKHSFVTVLSCMSPQLWR
jgi:hypothetical protein